MSSVILYFQTVLVIEKLSGFLCGVDAGDGWGLRAHISLAEVFWLMFQLDRQTDRQSNIINMRIEIELVLMNQIEKVTVCLSFLFLAYTTSHAHI